MEIENPANLPEGGSCRAALRPEAAHIGEEGGIACEATLSRFMGAYRNCQVSVGGTAVKINDHCPVNRRVYAAGEKARLSFRPVCAHIL